MLYALYFAAIVLANLLTTKFGEAAVMPVAFVLIGLTLVVRDRLHLRWTGRELVARMGALIAAGATASLLLNLGHPLGLKVALASFLAFAAAETVDGLAFQAGRRLPWLQRANGSNVLSALVDSAVFILVAFGGPLYLILAQWIVKVVGGFLWSLVLQPRYTARHQAVAA